MQSYDLIVLGAGAAGLGAALGAADAGRSVLLLDPKNANTRHPGATVIRTYGIGAQILKDLGLKRMRVLSAPKQLLGLAAFELEVTEYVDGGE